MNHARHASPREYLTDTPRGGGLKRILAEPGNIGARAYRSLRQRHSLRWYVGARNKRISSRGEFTLRHLGKDLYRSMLVFYSSLGGSIYASSSATFDGDSVRSVSGR